MEDNDLHASTKSLLIHSFKDVPNIPTHFITDELLVKPPFLFVLTLVRLYVKELGFAQGLFTNEELDVQQVLSKSDKVNSVI